MQAFQAGDSPLEDHLRNLILTNADQASTPGLVSPSAVPASFPNKAPRDRPSTGQEMQDAHPPSTPAQFPQRGARKRLNQAQRRQMSAQLSIPIDTRAHAPHSPDTYTHTQQPYANSQFRRNNTPRNVFQPQSATYHGAFQDPQAPGVNSPTHSTQRHHQGGSYSQSSMHSPVHQTDWRRQKPQSFDGFTRGVTVMSADAFPSRGRHPSQPVLYNPGGYRQLNFSPEQIMTQSELLERLCHTVVAGAEIEPGEISEKENFRARVEAICRDVISRHEIEVNKSREFQPQTVQLKCFGSLSSGFATKAADMDLGLLSPLSRLSPDSIDSPIPRLIEGALLEAGFGARLLTKTRVPIIKLCEKPGDKLRQDLLEERERWEKGLKDDDPDVEDEAIDDPDIPRETTGPLGGDVTHSPTSTQRRGSQRPTGSGVDAPCEDKLSSLKQAENQSLMSYYGNTKRLLRRLNGRDVAHSTLGEFTEADFKLLDSVAHAFILGLRDEVVRDRILAYPSFNASIASKAPNFRSLLGVYTMVEGESLVRLWETRTLRESTPQLEQGCQNMVQWWKDLQHTKSFGNDPLFFNKELQVVVDRLRQIPSIQLMQLRQDQHESPSQYHSRTVKIMTELGGAHPDTRLDIRPQIIRQYISGIRDDQLRDEVQNFADLNGMPSLRAIARKHKCLYLAVSFERAIEKSLYREEDIPVIREYISVLRRDLVKPPPHIGDFYDLVVPITQSNSELFAKIQQLPDPSKLAPHQPRDRYHDILEFPKSGVGVQCDINFSADLALQNTLLLRCYSYTDPRVRPLVLFVKHWAKARGINTPYRGTLSSYGYVLMMLHYLVNVAEPFVCPNLQHLAPIEPAVEGVTTFKGHTVRFWRDEQEIRRLAHERRLNQNGETLGSLLRGFFEYYAQNNMMSTIQKRGFDWGRDVLSLRTHGGLRSKAEKGWTGARTVIQPQTGAPPNPNEGETTEAKSSPTDNMHSQILGNHAHPEPPQTPDAATTTPTEPSAKPKELKEVRHRFLFAIEDPFELDHNVARTVTHNGIVAIRDEFRRAWRIIRSSSGKASHAVEDLLEDVKVHNELAEKKEFAELLQEIHGREMFPDSVVFK
ncbi:hypothetical protein F5X96DRAFT_483857 [Biscogniauxia mediterranea]|nr:hypothetical protein F5X96DRAFT_483857 [Biscogniauxia mediterranea]